MSGSVAIIDAKVIQVSGLEVRVDTGRVTPMDTIKLPHASPIRVGDIIRAYIELKAYDPNNPSDWASTLKREEQAYQVEVLHYPYDFDISHNYPRFS